MEGIYQAIVLKAFYPGEAVLSPSGWPSSLTCSCGVHSRVSRVGAWLGERWERDS